MLFGGVIYLSISSFFSKYNSIKLRKQLKLRGEAKVFHRNELRKYYAVKFNLRDESLINSPIANLTATELLREMREGRLKSEYIVKVFCARALKAGELTHCVTEELYEEAIEAAKQADILYASKSTSIPPLLGLPISIKCSLAQKNSDTTCGLAARTFKPYSNDGVIVGSLREMGAIPFVRTNIPQALLQPESSSFWGLTTNPVSIYMIMRNVNCSYITLLSTHFTEIFFSIMCS